MAEENTDDNETPTGDAPESPAPVKQTKSDLSKEEIMKMPTDSPLAIAKRNKLLAALD